MTYIRRDSPERTVVSQINDAIRDNPLAAGLIGAGVAWLVLGGRGLGALPRLANAGSAVADTIQHAGRSAAAAVTTAASNTVSAAASIVPDMAPDVDKLRAQASERGQALQRGLENIATDYTATLQSGLATTLERQPLVLGMIGLAIGAGLASTFAVTSTEREWLGDASKSVNGALKMLPEELRKGSPATPQI